MKTVLLVAYFGNLPNYFQLFLNSCKINTSYDWMIFTDDKTEYDYPNNVYRQDVDWESCRAYIQSKFDFRICLPAPQKLCDFKCAYGYIFDEYIKEYDWWGHCDLDQIFGNLSDFITDEMLNENDKLFSLGHLTLYRNIEENNKTFMSMLDGKERYREVFTTPKGCGFDEWLPDNVNDIYLNSERRAMLDNIGADINPYKTVFSLTDYDIKARKYVFDRIDTSVFLWENGFLYRVYQLNKEIHKQEFPYVHLQKRKMSIKCKDTTRYYIVPNKFVNATNELKLLKSTQKWKLFNFQYFKVKYNSLKYRIKNRDWKFASVFRD